jgi:phosphoribosylformimino-5-aminoimidazole carboxamide ribotide isomerase
MTWGGWNLEILAAIDLRAGRVVRLRQAISVARRRTRRSGRCREIRRRGARWLHVVDLDGARTGRPAHSEVIGRIVAAVGERASVEVAGGLRTAGAVAEVLAAGAARAVIGTAALQDRPLAAGLIARHGPDRLAVGLDVRAGMAVGDGWVDGAAGIPVRSAMEGLAEVGVRWFEVTAIERDGMLKGGRPARSLRRNRAPSRLGWISSTATSGPPAGCAGAIVGRAFYDGTLSGAALEAASG